MNATALGPSTATLAAHISLAGNEYESVQVILRVAAGCSAVRIEVDVSGLDSPDEPTGILTDQQRNCNLRRQANACTRLSDASDYCKLGSSQLW